MNYKKALKNFMQFPVIMAVFSGTGLLASFILAVEKTHLLEDPQIDLACNLNPVYSCQSVILSDQASILGFPNEFIGIGFFGGLLALSLALLSGAKFGKWLYKLTWLGLVGSMFFVFWFFYQTVYNINALCIYCSIIWFSSWALFVAYSKWLLSEKIIQVPKKLTKIQNLFVENTAQIWVALIVLFVALVLNHFWYYYGQYFGA